MENKGKFKLKTPHAIIRDAMRKEGLDYVTIAERIGEKRPDKLSVAVRCTNGIGRRAIEMRRKVAEALNLKPEDVWSKAFLQERPRARGGYTSVKAANEISDDMWETMSPSERVRSLLKERDMTMAALAEHIGVNYRVLTNNIYGTTADHTIRFRIAEILERAPASIWDTLYAASARDHGDLSNLANSPGLRAFLGFGDMTKPIDPNPPAA